MYDSYNRKINYLRISVIDRCNLRCSYCMPETGAKYVDSCNILTFEEISEIVRIAVELGIIKVRLTGGEPLIRKDIVSLVKMLANVNGIQDFAMTTNGILLPDLAQPLKDAGLHRLNISIDTLDSDKYLKITKKGQLKKVLLGIEAAQKAGFKQIKINTVVEQSSNEPDALLVREFARKNGFEIRYIRKMDLLKGEFWQVDGGEGGKCSSCNRIRLSSDGFIRPCLFGDLGYSVKELGIKKAILKAALNKQKEGQMSQSSTFYSLGG